MKALFSFISLILIFSSQTTLAAINSSIANNISVEIDYHDSVPNQFGQLNQHYLKNVTKFSSNPMAWTLIAGSLSQANPASNAESFILLGKLEEATTDKVKIRLLPITINVKNQPNLEQAITVPYGKRKHVEFKNDGKTVQIDVLASKT